MADRVVTIVVGPPCAGKSTFVALEMKPGDLAIDFDKIATALGSVTPHDSQGCVRDVSLKVRGVAINMALYDVTCDCWIIHTFPTPYSVAKYIKAGAIFHLIDPGKAECIARAKAEKRPDSTIKAINDWYANPPSLKLDQSTRSLIAP